MKGCAGDEDGYFCYILQTGQTRICDFFDSETELFVMLINGFQPLTNVRKNSILDVEEVLDPHL